METIHVGQLLCINSIEYMVECIARYEVTKASEVDNRMMRKQCKSVCHMLEVYDSEQFEVGDIVTDWLEEIRLKDALTGHVMIVHKRRIRKAYGLGTFEDGRRWLDGGPHLGDESAGEDNRTLHIAGQGAGEGLAAHTGEREGDTSRQAALHRDGSDAGGCGG